MRDRSREAPKKLAGWAAIVALTVLCDVSCDDTSNSSPAVGGAAAGASTAQTGGSCEPGWPKQCCDVVEEQPCQGLGEADCEANSLCRAIAGTPWAAGQGTVPEGPRGYVGCQSVCVDRAGADTFTCVFDPRDSATCFLVGSAVQVPDGWLSFEDCEALPEGACL